MAPGWGHPWDRTGWDRGPAQPDPLPQSGEPGQGGWGLGGRGGVSRGTPLAQQWEGCREPRWPRQPAVTLGVPARVPHSWAPHGRHRDGGRDSHPGTPWDEERGWLSPRGSVPFPAASRCFLPRTTLRPPPAPAREPAGVPLHRGLWATGPAGASVSPHTMLHQDRGTGAGGTRHTCGTVGNPTPGSHRSGCCPPALLPRRDGFATKQRGALALSHSPAPDAMSGGGSGVAGARPSPAVGTQAGKHFPGVAGNSCPSIPGPG